MTTNDTTTDDVRSQTPVTIISNSPALLLGKLLPHRARWRCFKQQDAVPPVCLHAICMVISEIPAGTTQLNELAITDGSRIMSVYRLVDAEKLKATPKQKRAELPTVWVITDGTNDDGKREYTTLLLPEDY